MVDTTGNQELHLETVEIVEPQEAKQDLTETVVKVKKMSQDGFLGLLLQRWMLNISKITQVQTSEIFINCTLQQRLL